MRGLLKTEPLELGASFVREKAFKRNQNVLLSLKS